MCNQQRYFSFKLLNVKLQMMKKSIYKFEFFHELKSLRNIRTVGKYKWSNGFTEAFGFLRSQHEGREGDGTPLQCSCLENPMGGGAWWAAVHWVAKSQTRLSDFTFTFHFHALEKEMATHSSVLVQRIRGTGEPGGLPSVGSHRVGHE